MPDLTTLQINQRMAALSGYEIVEGHDPTLCYVETREESSTVPRVKVYDVLGCGDMTLQAIKLNQLDVTWNGNQVTVHLALWALSSAKGEYVSYTHCEGDVNLAVCRLLLNASGLDKS